MTSKKEPITVNKIKAMKRHGEKIVALTAYDATFARLEDEAGIDIILVGDSLGMVIQGHKNTIPVTIEDIIYHSRACANGIQRALLVADMPFMSYQASAEQAMINAGRCLKEGNADAVKVEGGEALAETVRRMVNIGIPVMGHIGMQPQMVNVYGGYKIQGRKSQQAKAIIRDAEAIQDAGAFAIVLEKIPRDLAADITKRLKIPTIGIAAGPDCDGQILVNYDLFGLADQFNFKFVRRYLKLASDIRDAVTKWGDDIRAGDFPKDEESFE
ncbi:MAG: 3-methyl-2-oxobutanoate hydroxymethyltransferase [Candidatus Hatepunaea meridiana]|nr:3-methyl-2-oxobutanoate hydroxymethyltransferase [Candidatus Hatepunaea meridiana]